MKISDIKIENIAIGMRIKSLISDKQGTIINIDIKDDRYTQILWDGDDEPFSGFYGNDCECEIIE